MKSDAAGFSRTVTSRSVFCALFFSLLGAAIAGYLLQEHWFGGAMLGCVPGGTFDCESVNRSVFSEIRGIPVALLGLLGYLFCGWLLFRSLRTRTTDALGTVFVFAALALAGDGILFYAQAAVIHHWCLWCLMSYASSAGLLASCWIGLGSVGQVLPALRRDWDKLGRGQAVARVLAVLILVMAGYLLWRPLPSGAVIQWYVFNEPYTIGPPTLIGSDHTVEEIMAAPFLDPGPGSGFATGAANPILTIVEFGDLQCPVCQRFSLTMEEFVARHPNEVRWVFRHFPLDLICNRSMARQMHPFACSSARAAEAAGLQKKFWEFEHQVYSFGADGKRDLTDAGLEATAARVGLDLAKWKADRAADPVLAKISDDVEEGIHLDLDSTPTLFVNGRKITEVKDSKAMEIYLQLARAGKLDPRGPAAPSAK